MVVKLACLSDPKSWLAGALAPAIFSHVRVVEIRKLNKVLPQALQDGFKYGTNHPRPTPQKPVLVMKTWNILIFSVMALQLYQCSLMMARCRVQH